MQKPSDSGKAVNEGSTFQSRNGRGWAGLILLFDGEANPRAALAWSPGFSRSALNATSDYDEHS